MWKLIRTIALIVVLAVFLILGAIFAPEIKSGLRKMTGRLSSSTEQTTKPPNEQEMEKIPILSAGGGLWTDFY